jgi:hypothetical protein
MTVNLKMSLLSFFMQVNKTLTKLDLSGNSFGPEGGVALAKSLEVMMICCFRRHVWPSFDVISLSMTANLIFLFLLCSMVGEHNPEHPQLGI